MSQVLQDQRSVTEQMEDLKFFAASQGNPSGLAWITAWLSRKEFPRISRQAMSDLSTLAVAYGMYDADDIFKARLQS